MMNSELEDVLVLHTGLGWIEYQLEMLVGHAKEARLACYEDLERALSTAKTERAMVAFQLTKLLPE